MPSPAMHPDAHPLYTLWQKNAALLMQFALSPDVLAQATAGAADLSRGTPRPALGLAGSDAFAQLMQGLVRNYIEFTAALSGSAMAMLAQMPAMPPARHAARAPALAANALRTNG
ncbi:MAG TPA: hypothetical protein VFZ93_11945 [Albitalea sp.]